MTIYFDSAASYPILPEAKDAMLGALNQLYANPSSIHIDGERSKQIIEQTRESIAERVGAYPSEIVFTSGATESNNLALKSHFSLQENSKKRHLIISNIEHKCVHAIADFLSRECAVKVSVARSNSDGIVTREAVEALVTSETSLVSIMHVNNELGTINEVREIGEFCSSRGLKFHTDAAQSFLKTPLVVDEIEADFVSISGHKIGAPQGIGALYIRDRRKKNFEPVIHGAGQEEGLRGGTQATGLIAAFGAAVQAFPAAYARLCSQKLKETLVQALIEHGVPFKINGISLPSIVSLTVADTDVAALLRESEHEFSLATGSACSSKEIEPSHVLTAIGLDSEQARRTLRLSFHHALTPADIDRLVKRLSLFRV